MAKKMRTMKKIIILALIVINWNLMFSQELKRIDSTSIEFKAKLLTTSEYGIADKKIIISDIQSQKAIFLNTIYDNFLFIKITFNQPYRNSDGNTRTLIRNCNYYLAFSCLDNRFYRLGGFSTLDIDSFFSDLVNREGLIFKQSSELIEGIDIDCLYEYYKMNNKKRIKNGFKCFDNCQNVTSLGLKIN